VDEAEAPGPVVEVSWGASQDAGSGVAEYRVVVDGMAVAHTGPGERSARLSLPRGRHGWQVVAVDGAGNEAASPVRALTVVGSAPPRRPASSARLRISLPATLAPGARPALRLRLPKAATVALSVRRAASPRPLGRAGVRLKAGTATVRLPLALARSMRRPGPYVVTARAPGAAAASARVRVV
jgi:hypothetical protein